MLKRKFAFEVKRLKTGEKLPVVLSEEKIAKILGSVDNIKHKTILILVYSAGLRVSKVVKLRSEDFDSKRMFIHIKGSKGRKDRYMILSESMLEILLEYWQQYKPLVCLFEGAKSEKHISIMTVLKIFEHGRWKAWIKKEIAIHTLLRRIFATHLLESGVDLRYIKELLRYKPSRTTEIYTHVSMKSIGKIRASLDSLKLDEGGAK
jgi:site-specific recombinase XerD